MKNTGWFALSMFILALFQTGCSKSVAPETLQGSVVQLPGCKSAQLGKAGSFDDSCLTIQFQQSLLVDFCASGNCCPDSNRFSIRQDVRGDTIVVTIADTARALCRCTCNYFLHAEFADLPSDHYVFMVSREDYSSKAVLYLADVRRQ